MRRALPLVALVVAVTCAAPAGASAGGAVFPAGASAGAGGTGGAAAAGGAQYGTVTPSPRPVAQLFRVSPTTVRAPRLPSVRLRVDQPGTRTVRARIVFWPRGSGTLARADLGRVAVGRDVQVRWRAGTIVEPGRYLVRLHVVGRGGAPLARGAGTSGRANLVVRAPVVPAPAPTPAPALPIAAPAPAGPFAFPVAGPHTLGVADARFGAQRGSRRHEGQDILAAEGTPVVAPVGGTVRHTDHQPSGAGYYVVVDGADGRAYFFAHCRKDSFAVAKGALVAAGTPLCAVGRTGRATGPHLHFEIWLGGWRASRESRPIDPLPDLLAWGG
jgi:murein DD-endopeptidase MepM/ murein hydrolase activator NlpD